MHVRSEVKGQKARVRSQDAETERRTADGTDMITAKYAKNAKMRRGKGKWQSGGRNVESDVIPTVAKRSGGISQLLDTGNW